RAAAGTGKARPRRRAGGPERGLHGCRRAPGGGQPLERARCPDRRADVALLRAAPRRGTLPRRGAPGCTARAPTAAAILGPRGLGRLRAGGGLAGTARERRRSAPREWRQG